MQLFARGPLVQYTHTACSIFLAQETGDDLKLGGQLNINAISCSMSNIMLDVQYHAQCPIKCQYLAKYCRCIYLSFHSSTFKDLRFFYHKIIIDYKYLIGIWVREVSSSTLPARIKKMLKICTTPFVQELWTRYDTGDRRSEDF